MDGVRPSREKARQNVCISNLHQIEVALSLYCSDYDGQEALQGVPMTASQLGLPTEQDGIFTFDNAYVKDHRVLYYPDFWLDPNKSPQEKKQAASSYSWSFISDDPMIPKPSRFSTLVARDGDHVITTLCKELPRLRVPTAGRDGGRFTG